MFVIGVAGQAQMGKDTLADHLAKKLNSVLKEKGVLPSTQGMWRRTAFADNVKRVYQDTFDRDRAFIEEWKVKPDPPPGFDMTVRKSLQFIGDGFRKIQPTIWLDLAFRDTSCPIIISDTRYVNEFVRVKQEGGMNILVGRKDKLNDDPNGSEAQIRPYVKWCLDKFGYDNAPEVVKLDLYRSGNDPEPPEQMDKFDLYVNNNGTIEELYDAIDKHVVPFVEHYVFQFPEKKEEECLISN